MPDSVGSSVVIVVVSTVVPVSSEFVVVSGVVVAPALLVGPTEVIVVGSPSVPVLPTVPLPTVDWSGSKQESSSALQQSQVLGAIIRRISTTSAASSTRGASVHGHRDDPSAANVVRGDRRNDYGRRRAVVMQSSVVGEGFDREAVRVVEATYRLAPDIESFSSYLQSARRRLGVRDLGSLSRMLLDPEEGA